VYWEPDWLPVNDATWATDAGISYLNTTGNVGNAWENQALFDFSGDALPALAEFAAGDQ
ncbi:MAG: glycosyl hydrolase 53 family protein, partial [Aeromonadaceae bacterium]|nr:glycosyl hydrolase 53 family protein [Aeromonadaceae bacterium]